MEEKRKYKKRSSWSTGDEMYLVELWGEHIQQLRGARKNSHVYEEMRKKLQIYGCVVGTDEIRTKINNLTSRYRKEKSAVGISGGSPSNWPLYADIHSVLGSFNINNLELVREESINEESFEDVQFLDDSMMSQPSTTTERRATPGPSASTSKNRIQAEMLDRMRSFEQQMEKQTQYLQVHDSQMYQLEVRKTDLLEQFVSDNKELKDAFVEYLKKH